MMSYKTDLKFETLLAMKTLNKVRNSDCEQKAEAAKKILEDKELLSRYIQVRADKRNEKFSPKKEKRLTWWKHCVNLIRRKA